MVELTCDTCGEHIAVILSLVGDEVVAEKHPTTACLCVDKLTPAEVMEMLEDAYTDEGLSSYS